jgi:hypothetical protein
MAKEYDSVVGWLSGLWKPEKPSKKVLASGMVEVSRFLAELKPVVDRCRETGNEKMRLAVILNSSDKSDFTLLVECVEKKEKKEEADSGSKPDFANW